MAFGSRSPGDIVSEVLMSRTNFKGALLLVEGPTDSKFIRPFLKTGEVEIVICDGKSNACTAIEQLNSLGATGVVAFVDDDFDSIVGIAPVANVIKTDTHDTETMMLSSQAFDSVIIELGDKDKVSRFENTVAPVAQNLKDMAKSFGRLRYLNDITPGYKVKMGDFRPWKYVNQDTWELSTAQLLADYANKVGVPIATLDAQIAVVPAISDWNLVQGHDTMAILCIGLRKILGNDQISEKDLGQAFRLAYHRSIFATTAVFTGFQTWEAVSPPYAVLQ